MTVWAACSDGAVRQYSYSEGQAGERLELTREGQEVSSHCLQVVRLLGAQSGHHQHWWRDHSLEQD